MNNVKNNKKDPLKIAVCNNFTNEAKTLIRQGCDVNGADEHGATPLMYASVGGHVNMIEMLLDKGAAINQKTPRGERLPFT